MSVQEDVMKRLISNSIMLFVLAIGIYGCPDFDKNAPIKNIKPVAKIDAPERAGFREEVTLDGSGSYDENGDELTFKWRQVSGPTVELSSSINERITFKAPAREGVVGIELIVNDGFEDSEPAYVSIELYENNSAPIANAGEDITVAGGSTVTLHGSGTDADNDRLTYHWQQVAGDYVEISDANSPECTFIAPERTQTLVFSLVVSDGIYESEPDLVNVFVEHNNRPTAEAGEDKIVNIGALVQLDGHGFDADDDDLTFHWRQVGGSAQVELSADDIPNPTFTAPEAADLLVFELVVSDGKASSIPDQVTITVKELPVAVVAEEYIAVKGGVLVTLDGSASHDSQQRELSYKWTQTYGPDVTLSDPTAAITTFIAPTIKAELGFELVVNNGEDDSMPAKVVVVTDNPPVANAGEDQVSTPGTLIVLSGSGHDPDGDNVAFFWTQIDGPSVELSSSEIANPQFTAPNEAGKLTFQLVVSDGVLDSEPDTVDIIINRLPTAKAGDDLLVEGGAQVSLDGSQSSDPDGQELSYEWTQTGGPSVVLFGANTANPSFIAPQNKCAIAFRLVVNDGLSNSQPDEVVVFVNNRPVADAGEDRIVTPGAHVMISGKGTDRDNEPLTYHWQQESGPEVALSGADTSTVSFDAPQEVGAIVLSLTVSDGQQTSEKDLISIIVNHPPIADAGDDQNVSAGESVELDGSRSHDLEESELHYNWRQVIGPEVLLLNSDTATPSFVAPYDTTILVFELVVSDSYSESEPDTVQINVHYNRPPVANAGENISIPNNDTATLTGSVSDPDGDPIMDYEWSVVSNPPNAVYTLTGEHALIAYLEVHTKGDYVLSFRAKDNLDWGAPSTVVVHAENNPPVADAGDESASVANRSELTLLGSGTDEDGDSIVGYKWSVVSSPPDAIFSLEDSDSATARFTPLAKGTYQLSLIVFDGDDWSSPDYITVEATNNPPTVDAGESVSGNNESQIAINAIATDIDEDELVYNWSILSTTPAGLNGDFANSQQRTTTFTPHGKGVYLLQISVTDSDGANATDTVEITASNNPPIADAGDDLQNASTGYIQLSGVRSSDIDGDFLAYQWEILSKPSDANDATIIESNTASPKLYAPTLGIYTVQLTVTDTDGASSSDTVVVNVIYHGPVVDATANPESGLPGTYVELDGTGSIDPDGGDIQSYIWEQVAGDPVELESPTSATAHFTIPANAQYDPAGENKYTFRLTVVDDEGAQASKEVNVYLLPADDQFIYVSTTGSENPTSCGTRNTPCKYIQDAILIAQSTSKAIVIAGGEYSTMSRSIYVPPNIKMYGGFDPDTWNRDILAYPSEIHANDHPTEIMDNCIDEDCNGFLNNPPIVPTTETCDYIDNDWDGHVDENVAGCNHSSESDDGFEENDTMDSAYPIEKNVLYGELRAYEDPDYFVLDTSDRPSNCTEWVLHVWVGNITHVTAAIYNGDGTLLDERTYNSIYGGSLDIDIPGSALTDTTYLRITTYSAGTRYRLRVFYTQTGLSKDNYCNDRAVFNVIAPYEPWDESKMNVMDGLTIYDHESNLQHYKGAAIWCDQCSMKLSNCNIYVHEFGRREANSNSCESAGVLLYNTDYAVEISNNYIETGYGRVVEGILFTGERIKDVQIRNNTLVVSEAKTLLDNNLHSIFLLNDTTEHTSRPFTRFVIDSNHFILKSSQDTVNAGAIVLKHTYRDDYLPESPIYITNNIIESSAGAVNVKLIDFAANYENESHAKAFISNNTLYNTGVSPSTMGIKIEERLKHPMTVINNYMYNLHHAISASFYSDGINSIFFANNILNWQECAFYYQTCHDDIEYINSFSDGSHDNTTGSCVFEDAENGDFHLASESLCIDYGSLSADIPETFPQVPDWFTHDADGNPRTIDDPYTIPPSGVSSDNTDVGAYERQ